VPSEGAYVTEYFRGRPVKMRWFETDTEAYDYVNRQGEEPGVEWVVQPVESS